MQKQADGRYVILNREYKPLGFKTNAHVKYEDYPIAVKFKRFTKAQAKSISCSGSEDLDTVSFYNDGCIPTASEKHMAAYLKRLAALAKLQVA
jgi:hypothetical protein